MELDKELLDKKRTLMAEGRSVCDKADSEKRAMNSEEREKYDRIFKDIEGINATLDIRHKQRLLEQESSEPATTRAGGVGTEIETKDQKEFARRSLNKYFNDGLQALDEKERRALSVSTDGSGGYTVKLEDFRAELIKNVDDLLPLIGFCTKFTLKSAKELVIPRMTADVEDPTWGTENSAYDEETALTLAQFKLDPKPANKYIKISNTLARESALPIEDFVKGRLAYKFARAMQNGILNGSSSDAHLGIFTADSGGIPTSRDIRFASETALDADTFVKAKPNIKQQYWNKLRWTLHRDVYKAASLLKDSNGRYLLQDATQGLANPMGETLCGFPYHLLELCPNTMAADAYVAVLGDFSQYYICDTLDFTLTRLNELFALNNQFGISARMEQAGKPALSEAFTRLQMKAAA